MRVLFVCSHNSGKISPFILEQAEVLRKSDIRLEFYLIRGKGIFGYIKNLKPLKVAIKSFKPDLIHAHFGLSALLTVLTGRKNVISTFHGSDINNSKVLFFSKLAIKFSKKSIFVNTQIREKAGNPLSSVIIPCGIDLRVFKPIGKSFGKQGQVNKASDKLILFSSSFSNKVKNYPLAKEACKIVNNNSQYKIELIELKNYERNEVSELLNAVDCLLLTSFNEGSPQIIKEAMACNSPIVSTDVGDVKWILGDTAGCYTTSFDAEDVAAKLKLAIEFSEKYGETCGRQRIIDLGLDSETVAKRIIEVYNKVLNK